MTRVLTRVLIRLLIRPARADDALCLGVLATQVFLDTYARKGITQTIAAEVRSAFSTEAIAVMLVAFNTTVFIAEVEGHVVGFVQITLGAQQALAPAGRQVELDRLYIQEPFTRQGIGNALLLAAEKAAAQQGAQVMWLSAWVGNERALAFYASQRYEDCGKLTFRMQGEAIPNRVLSRTLPKHTAGRAG